MLFESYLYGYANFQRNMGECHTWELLMLATRQPVLRRFWYACLPLTALDIGPKSFTLLGEKLVLWKDQEGRPAALKDRCCHRTAKLSKGFVDDAGCIVCGYHGWTYDSSGHCIKIPQSERGRLNSEVVVDSFRCVAKYGYVWVALDEPLAPIPNFPEDRSEDYRRIFQFHELWATSALRFMENSFDNAHFSYVHKNSFGLLDQPQPSSYSLVETADGFEAETIVPIQNPVAAFRVTGSTNPLVNRHLLNRWWMPFVRRFGCQYPDSGVHHIIYNCATPVDDEHIMLNQWLFRNDKENDCSSEELIAWDRAILNEDRDILESTDPDTCIDTRRKVEKHMPSDRPGMIMRKYLMRLLTDHGEEEISYDRTGR